MLQIQQLLHHLVHLPSLIHDHFTVKLSAFLIFIDIVQQPFRVTLYDGDRSLQLMRYIGKEFLSHLIDLDFLLNINLQLLIGIPQV